LVFSGTFLILVLDNTTFVNLLYDIKY